MKVEVHLHATLRLAGSGGKKQILILDLPENYSITNLLDQLEIDLDPEHMLFVLNGRTTSIDQILEDGDVINLMTAVSGGK